MIINDSSISQSQLVIKKLTMRTVCTMLALRVLSDVQKAKRKAIHQNLLPHVNGHPKFLDLPSPDFFSISKNKSDAQGETSWLGA